ncbi:MAG: ArsO family NAD(P)H-dependent flavin-containing monooxygenase [Nakamurella sp.]
MELLPAPTLTDVVVIGGGQAGLAIGYHLRRAEVDFVILDAQSGPGGAWRHGWDSLRLFSPAPYSSLPGWPMPVQPGEPFPTAGHVRAYLSRYERRYELPVRHNVPVDAVTSVNTGSSCTGGFVVHTRTENWRARAVVSATGTWRRPVRPRYPGAASFTGVQLHAVAYHRPDRFTGQHVLVVGGGNSAAQIVAEVSTVADTTWCTLRPPRFMPDDVDGSVLFDLATQRQRAARAGETHFRGGGLGDIVMVPPVKAARGRGVMVARPMFTAFTATGVRWNDGSALDVDAVIWCTGFEPDLHHLDPLGPAARDARAGTPSTTDGTRSTDHPGLYFLGYGEWTGPASATLVGAGRTARLCAAQIVEQLADGHPADRPGEVRDTRRRSG